MRAARAFQSSLGDDAVALGLGLTVGGASVGSTALMSFPLFMLLGTRNPQLGWIAIVLGLAVGHAAMYGPQASFLSELFGTKTIDYQHLKISCDRGFQATGLRAASPIGVTAMPI